MDRVEKLVFANSQNALVGTGVEILGHRPLGDIGTDDGTSGGTALTTHGQVLAAAGGADEISFGPLEPGALYEFNTTNATATAPVGITVMWQVGTDTTAADIAGIPWNTADGVLQVKLDPDQTHVNFTNLSATACRVHARRLR